MNLENKITNKNGSYNEVAKPILQLANNHFTKLFRDLEELNSDLSVSEISELLNFALNHQLKSLSIKLMIFDGD